MYQEEDVVRVGPAGERKPVVECAAEAPLLPFLGGFVEAVRHA